MGPLIDMTQLNERIQMKVKLIATLVSAALMTACSSDSSSPSENEPRTITIGFDYGLVIDPMADDATGTAIEHLLKDDYYLLINGSEDKEEAIGPFNIDDSYSFEVRDGYNLKVVHGDILEKLDAEVTEEYSVAGEFTVATDIHDYTMELENRHFTYVTIDSNEKIENLKVNGVDLYADENSYFHAFVNGESYVIEGVTQMGPYEQELDAVVGQHHKWYIIDGEGGFEIENDWDVIDRPAIPQEPSIPEPNFSYKGLEIISVDVESAVYTATVNADQAPETGLLVPAGISIERIKFDSWMKHEGEAYGYTNIYLSEGGDTKCAVILADDSIKMYETSSCAGSGQSEAFDDWSHLVEERSDLQFQSGRFEFGLGLVNIINRNSQAIEGDELQIHMSYELAPETHCEYHRVDNASCVGTQANIIDESNRASVGIQVAGLQVGETTLERLNEPEVDMENTEGAFINFYCKSGIQAETIVFILSKDWEQFVIDNSECKLTSYQGLEAIGSHAILRSGSTGSSDHQFELSGFEISIK